MASRNKQTYSGLPTIGINDHDEKSSQRVPSPYLILLLVFYLLVAFLTKVIEGDLPNVIQEKDIAADNSNTFSEQNARMYLHNILGDKPRVAGTAYHLEKTKDIKDLVDKIASSANLPVKTDWQFVDGDYWLAFTTPHVNAYQNLSNIIAVLEGDSGFNPDGTTNTSLLVNCHYDSVPFAIGASDNGVFCSAMAEILAKLSRRKKKFKHNVIFIFNGAEESALLASHGFLKHQWAKGVTNVINLDSAGMNGKPSVFQVTDPRVLEVYRKTTGKPNAQGLGEVLFASGIIPSDTDFRIFRDFGNIQGIDIAFVKGGNVYHTRNDRPELIESGVIQNAGNMLLNVIKEAADSEELKIKETKSTVVYYDYIGLFLFTYSHKTALFIDSVVAVLGFASVFYYLSLFGLRKSTVRELLWSVLGRIYCLISGILIVGGFTVVMIYTTTQMRYLSENWMVIPLYWIPFFIGSLLASYSFDSWRNNKITVNRSIRCVQTSSATRLLLSISLFILCFFPSLSNVRYIITVLLTIMIVSSFVNMTLVRYGRIKGWRHLILEVLLTLPATMFCFSLAFRFTLLLIPIMGRSGNDYPDIVIAIVSVGLAAIVGLTMSGIELLFSRKHAWAVISIASLICIVIMFIPMSPYRGENTTQRHYWFHTQITTYNKNFTQMEQISGVVITKVDLYSVQYALEAIKNSPFYVKNDIDGRSNRNDSSMTAFKITDSDIKPITDDDCEEFLYCKMPLYRPRFDKFIKGSLFVKMAPPAEFKHSLSLDNRSCVEDTCVMNFILNGSTQNSITIWPRLNVTLEKWSFESPLKETMVQNGRKVYVIIQTMATYQKEFRPLEFQLVFHVPKELQSQIIADISHHAHKIYNPEDFTDEYKKLIQAMPEYFNVATFLTFTNNYKF
ncbi:unnamed protein product, partial [Brenthis ino]